MSNLLLFPLSEMGDDPMLEMSRPDLCLRDIFQVLGAFLVRSWGLCGLHSRLH